MDEKARKYSGANFTGPSRSSPYPVQRLSAPISLVDTAREIERASLTIGHQTNAQLNVIAKQIEFLREQARGILQTAAEDLRLHRAECRFEKVPGQVYHLYQRGDGRTLFSMLSPSDHAGTPPHLFVGSYRLRPDLSWAPIDEEPCQPAANAAEQLGTIDTLLDERKR